jgi:hypothetical protein
MREDFAGYYAPTEAEYGRLWQEALIVLDTNTLLDLYRFPATARDELFAALDLVKDRLWIPHQVGLEFQRHRSDVIARERASSEAALKAIEQLVGETRGKVDSLQIEKRGLGLDVVPLFSDLEKFGASIKDAVTRVRDAQPDIALSDAVRDRLDELLAGRVGPAPKSQEDLDILQADGDQRFANKVPPGYTDVEKEKNPDLATFQFDGLTYQRKFGDLILWRQLVSHAKENGHKLVMLITSERKEDWWWKEKGRTLGPRPELTREIMQQGGVETFWMYAPDQFLVQSERYTKANVTQKAVDEIAQALMTPPSVANWMNYPAKVLGNPPARFYGGGAVSAKAEGQAAVRAVGAWLVESGHEVEIRSHGFPDFIVYDQAGRTGYDVKFQKNFTNMLFSPAVVNGMLRGYHATHEGLLDRFILVVVIDEDAYSVISDQELVSDLELRLERLLERYSIDGIVLGAVVGAEFECLTSQYKERDDSDNPVP